MRNQFVKTAAIAGNSAIAAPIDSVNKGTTMNKFDINAIAIAMGLAFSAGAMAQTMSKDQDKSVKDSMAVETPANAKNDANNMGAAAARKDAQSDKRDVDYAVAKEKCDAFAGDAKSTCMNEAKARLGKM